MELLHGFTADRVHGITGVTSGTPVPETAMDFIRGMGFLVVAVEQIGTNKFLATVTRVLNIGFVLFGCVQQPLMERRNDGDRIFGKVIGAIHKMTGRPDGECCKRIDVCDVTKQFAKF